MGNGPTGSASIPMLTISWDQATAAALYPSQCVMLPTTPDGRSEGAPRSPGRMGAGGIPNCARALRAQLRTALNSFRRLSTARAMTALSSGNRCCSR